MNTPSQQLACKIADRLLKDKLLTKTEVDKLLPKLVDGKVKAEDWRLAVELSQPKEAVS